jgi:uncharacterized protein
VKRTTSAQDYVGLFYAGGLGGVQEDCKESIRWFLKAAKSGNIESKNNAAWMFATCIDARHRDGKEAVRLAQEAIFQLGPTASYVGTLAAAFAEIGEFEKAIELQEESLSRMRLDRASEEMIAEANTLMNFFARESPGVDPRLKIRSYIDISNERAHWLHSRRLTIRRDRNAVISTANAVH